MKTTQEILQLVDCITDEQIAAGGAYIASAVWQLEKEGVINLDEAWGTVKFILIRLRAMINEAEGRA